MIEIPKLLPQFDTSKTQAKARDLSIIIAHRGPEMGLWATIESCCIDLEGSGLDYEFIIVCNGEEKLSHDLSKIQFWLFNTGRVGDFIHTAEPLSPPTARQMATEKASGKFLFFFDNHCLVGRDYFKRAISTMEKHNIDLLHSTTRFFQGEFNWYEYHLTLKRDFWIDKPYNEPVNPDEPYKIAMAGHGGFVARKSAWDETGGYWQGFNGYGGEESYLDLKFWLLGKENWIDPKLIHYHWAGKRDYIRHFSDDYFRNMMACANIIGGEEWMMKVYKSFTKYFRYRSKEGEEVKPMFDLLIEAQQKSQPHADWLTERRVKTLDELLLWFSANNIRH